MPFPTGTIGPTSTGAVALTREHIPVIPASPGDASPHPLTGIGLVAFSQADKCLMVYIADAWRRLVPVAVVEVNTAIGDTNPHPATGTLRYSKTSETLISFNGTDWERALPGQNGDGGTFGRSAGVKVN